MLIPIAVGEHQHQSHRHTDDSQGSGQTQALVTTLFFNLGQLTFTASRCWEPSANALMISKEMPASGGSISHAINCWEIPRKSVASVWHSGHSSKCDKDAMARSAGSS